MIERTPGSPLYASRHAIVGFAMLCGVAALTLTTLLPAQADAARRRSRKPTVLVLRVESAAIDDKARVALTKALVRKARQYKHYKVKVSKTDLVEEMFAFECTEAGVECLSKIGKKYRASLVVYSEVSKDDAGGHTWSMRVVQMKSKDSPIARVAQSTAQKLEAVDKPKKAAANGLLVLIGPVELPESRVVSPGTLHVRLIGGGVALVYVNGKLAGRSSLSGLKVTLAPGTYKVKVVRAGHKDWEQAVKIASGKTIDRIVELEALPEEKTRVGSKPKVAAPVTSKWWFWAGVAGATAAVAVTVWAVTRQDEATPTGNAAFSLDSNDAHLDPVFGGG